MVAVNRTLSHALLIRPRTHFACATQSHPTRQGGFSNRYVSVKTFMPRLQRSPRTHCSYRDDLIQNAFADTLSQILLDGDINFCPKQIA
jgi:hypothetical protein